VESVNPFAEARAFSRCADRRDLGDRMAAPPDQPNVAALLP
jgi:hypothetical protein